MSFPARYTVQTAAYVPGQKDAHNNDVDAWASPVDQPAIGWASPNSAQPKYMGATRTIIDVELYVPVDFVCGPRDRVTLTDGKVYEAVGYPEDYTHGPFDFAPGLVVNLVRVEG